MYTYHVSLPVPHTCHVSDISVNFDGPSGCIEVSLFKILGSTKRKPLKISGCGYFSGSRSIGPTGMPTHSPFATRVPSEKVKSFKAHLRAVTGSMLAVTVMNHHEDSNQIRRASISNILSRSYPSGVALRLQQRICRQQSSPSLRVEVGYTADSHRDCILQMSRSAVNQWISGFLQLSDRWSYRRQALD